MTFIRSNVSIRTEELELESPSINYTIKKKMGSYIAVQASKNKYQRIFVRRYNKQI